MEGKLIVSEQGRDRVHELTKEVVRVGRGPQADLHLRDESVSGLHCEIRPSGTGYKVVDLETASGTQVNGVTINQQVLQNGDTIKIGNVRLTYLGVSAAPSPKPKRPLIAPLERLPEDAEGRPRRFYRHEARGGLGSGLQLILVFGCLALVAVLIVWFGTSTHTVDGTGALERAASLIDAAAAKNDVRELERVIQLLRDLPEGSVGSDDREDQMERARGEIARIQADVQRVAHDDWVRRILAVTETPNPEIGWLRTEVAAFRRQHPTSRRLPELEQALARFDPEVAGVLGFDRSMERLNALVAAGTFSGAFALLDELEANPSIVRARGDHLAIKRTAVESAFESHFAAQMKAAVDARTNGDLARARKILQGLVADGREPHASQARALLARLE